MGSAFAAGIVHHKFPMVDSLKYDVIWFLGSLAQVIAASILSFKVHRYYGMATLGGLVTGYFFTESAIVGLAAILIYLSTILRMGYTTRNSYMVSAAVEGILLHIFYLGRWRTSCSPTGLVPQTWPEDALFPWWFNHNAWYHIGCAAFVILLAYAVRPIYRWHELLLPNRTSSQNLARRAKDS